MCVRSSLICRLFLFLSLSAGLAALASPAWAQVLCRTTRLVVRRQSRGACKGLAPKAMIPNSCLSLSFHLKYIADAAAALGRQTGSPLLPDHHETSLTRINSGSPKLVLSLSLCCVGAGWQNCLSISICIHDQALPSAGLQDPAEGWALC